MEYLLGRNAVREALRAGRRRFEQVMVAEGTEPKGTLGDILALCRQAKIVVQTVKRRELDQIGEEIKHQGVAAKVSNYPLAEIADMLALASLHGEHPLLLALDALEDPQNVGSLLRTAEAVGVHGVVIPERRAVGVTPAVSRASAGAVEHLLVAQVVNLGRALGELKRLGLWVVGVEETPQSQSYLHVDLNMPLALVLGSEGHGMRPSIAKACDLLVQLPMRGQIHSLNVSVAGSILLYRAWEARQTKA